VAAEERTVKSTQWDWLLDESAVAHLTLRPRHAQCTQAVCGADVDANVRRPASCSETICQVCREFHEDVVAGQQLRGWRERGQVVTTQNASDVVTVHVGALILHVWRHPDGALIEAVDRDTKRHAAYASVCRDPEEAGGKAVMLAVSHGADCAERPRWPVMDTSLVAVD
jgi:hypothetical protein